ncbi:glucan biosynthesis protein C [Murinocardiopsis flavida]|uniref:Glucan biosynthesis protein C n=1 Tax=Murinocardiopsis flavida TaxID=645275 RepID=A0A2P8CVH7_9ACTN|nr:acyltransferase family protein [Murinocardiopsis flavida]PSK88950.1 glucan biosynthesis protein C [Murinocardiopsis flavida]
MTDVQTDPHRPPPERAAPADRQHGLDALRGGALLLGIVLHGLMPFLPDDYWLVTDRYSADSATAAVSVIHLFRMTLFMLLAGYFGRMVVQRRGSGRYVRDRALRIGLPVLAFWPVAVLPLGVIAAVAGTLDGATPADETEVTDPLQVFAPAHMWFLVVLLQCVLITALVRFAALRILGPDRSGRIADRIGSLLASPAGVLVAALPYLAGLLLQGPDDFHGIQEPVTVLPEAAALTAYLGAYAAGWFLHARPDALTRLSRGWPVHLAAAAGLSALGLLDPEVLSGPAEAAVTAAAGWTWTFGLLGLCTRTLHRERPAVRYLADASYWMYLMHLPLLLLVELGLRDLHWPIVGKLAVAGAATTAVLLISYDLLVRPTWLGRWLNGRRRPSALLARTRRTGPRTTEP